MSEPRVEKAEDGHPIWIHACADISPEEEVQAHLPLGRANGWSWNPDGSLTPSIHCLNCGIHGFWTGTTFRLV